MEISNLYERVLLAQFAYHYVNQAALGILGTIAVTAFIYDAIRGVLGAGTTHLRNLAGRLLLSLVALGLYPRIVRTACESSTELAQFMAENAGWDDYWNSVKTGYASIETMPEVQDTENNGFVQRQFSKITGLGKTTLLTLVLSWSYFLLRLVFYEIQAFTALCATLLYVLGPLMIVLGIVTQSRSLWRWLQSLVQVALWPMIPPLLILVVVGTHSQALETSNVVHVLAENLTLGILGLSTPIVVAYLFGQLDMASLGMAGLLGATAMVSASGMSKAVGNGAVTQSIDTPLPPSLNRWNALRKSIKKRS